MKGALGNLLVLVLLAAGFGGVATGWRLPWRKPPAAPEARKDWCAEHDCPESECYI